MSKKISTMPPAMQWFKKHGFKVVDASGPNGTYKNLLEWDKRTTKELLNGRGRVTAQAIGAEGQDGRGSHRVTAQAIGAEGQDGRGPGRGRVTAQAIGAEGQDGFNRNRVTAQAIGAEAQ